ncbi:MAG: hypothetical protein MJE77_06840 [Proteobacteria bacterium]|nr:hypothetical protein [Pseudomonadota bacterium]
MATGRGPQRAVLAYLRWLRQYRWRLSLDIRRYFPSIHHDTLCELFARRLCDRRTVELIRAMVAAGGQVYRTPVAISILGLETEPVPPGRGLPLGGYLSHWSGGLVDPSPARPNIPRSRPWTQGETRMARRRHGQSITARPAAAVGSLCRYS